MPVDAHVAESKWSTAVTRPVDAEAELARLPVDVVEHAPGRGQVRTSPRPRAPRRARLLWPGYSPEPWIVPIPGTTKPHRLQENLAAADVTLTQAELAQLNDLSSRTEIQGGRYPDALQAQTNL